MKKALPSEFNAAADAIANRITGEALDLVRGSTLTPKPIEWLWREWLAGGKFHVFGGAPGTGKTSIAMALAATLTSGGNWPDGTRASPSSVAIWSGEDDLADTLVPRLKSAGADLDRVYFLGGVKDEYGRRPFDPAKDIDLLAAKLRRVCGVRLLIVDPVVSAVTADSHKNAETRRSLQPLADLAASLGVAVVGITHFSKGTAGREPVERLTGSLAFGALARVVWVAAKNQKDGGERIFLRAKSNIGPDGGGFTYDLRQGELSDYPGVITSRAVWGEALEGTARELLADADAPEEESAVDAKQFLTHILAGGSMQAAEIFSDAGQFGFSKRTIQRAAEVIGIHRQKEGMRGGWAWSLPKMPKLPEDAEDTEQKRVTPSAPSAAPSGYCAKNSHLTKTVVL
jgi:putative DNA primase/helicase